MDRTSVNLPNSQENIKTVPEKNALPLQSNVCPFKNAENIAKRIKLLIWGPVGSGKSVLSLQFPCPVVMDFERGTEPYINQFKFHSDYIVDADIAMERIEWLLKNKHEFQSINIDPFTNYVDLVYRKWSDISLIRRKGTKGHRYDFYDFQPLDWNSPKAEIKTFLRKLSMLDMNIVGTAGEKKVYEKRGDNFMVPVGETFDAEKNINRFFDTVVRIVVRNKEHICIVEKDRTHKLPNEFKISYEKDGKVFITAKPMLDAFGPEYLHHEPKPIRFVSVEQKEKIEQLIKKFGMSDADRDKRLLAYDAETIDDLTFDNAQIILDKLQSADKAGANKKEKGE
jgi:hypothetical protein